MQRPCYGSPVKPQAPCLGFRLVGWLVSWLVGLGFRVQGLGFRGLGF